MEWLVADRATQPPPRGERVVGDSAGGGLALALLLRLRDLGEPLPDAAVLLSPWTDLTASGASVDMNRGRDLWFTRAHLESWARYVVADADPRSSYLSPAFGSLAALPPLMLLAGEDELLLDDTLRVHRAALSAGVASELLVGRGMQHDWPLALPWLPESRKAWQRMARFLGSNEGSGGVSANDYAEQREREMGTVEP